MPIRDPFCLLWNTVVFPLVINSFSIHAMWTSPTEYVSTKESFCGKYWLATICLTFIVHLLAHEMAHEMMHLLNLFPPFKRFCLILLCGIYCNYPFVPSNRTSLSCIFMKLTNIQCLECTLSSHQSLLTSRRPRDTTRAKINKHQFVNNPAHKMLFHSPELSPAQQNPARPS